MWLNATDITSTTITIQWGAVPCMDQNSEITGYKVRYGPVGSSQRATDAVSGSASTGGTYTPTGLIPFTNYSIEVAAVNSNGDIGPYTLPGVHSTVHIQSCKLNCSVASLYSSYIGNDILYQKYLIITSPLATYGFRKFIGSLYNAYITHSS